MKRYSISEAARLLGVHRATLHRWIEEGVVPAPIAEEIAGARLRYWTEVGLAKLKQYRRTQYWGKGKSRRRGKKAKQEKT